MSEGSRLYGCGRWDAVWQRSQPFPDVRAKGHSPGFTAEKLLDAVASNPARCSRCEGDVDGILTGAVEMAVAEMASIVAQAYAIASLDIAAEQRQARSS